MEGVDGLRFGEGFGVGEEGGGGYWSLGESSE